MLILILFPVFVSAQDVKDDETMNYTYLGPSLSFAYNKAEYDDWIDNSTKTKKMTGYSFAGGLALNIFADPLCGDFQLKYTYNKLDYTLTFLEIDVTGKYLYPLNNSFSVGAGLGLYFETPPSNRSHNGSAGLQFPLTLLHNISQNTKIYMDLYYKYGSFGIGENTESMSAGINVGLIFKVGRI